MGQSSVLMVAHAYTSEIQPTNIARHYWHSSVFRYVFVFLGFLSKLPRIWRITVYGFFSRCPSTFEGHRCEHHNVNDLISYQLCEWLPTLYQFIEFYQHVLLDTSTFILDILLYLFILRTCKVYPSWSTINATATWNILKTTLFNIIYCPSSTRYLAQKHGRM